MLQVKMDALVELLKEETEKPGMTVREIARKADVNHVRLLNIMAGKSVPEVGTLGILSDYFDINPIDLMETREILISVTRLSPRKRDRVLKIMAE